MAAFSNLGGTAGSVAANPESKTCVEKEKGPANSGDNDIHSRFGINVGFSEFLQNWGFLNLSPFRRKSSKPTTPSPSSQSPQKQVQACTTNISPDGEHIELVQFSNFKKLEADHRFGNVDFSGVEDDSETQETILRNSGTFIWAEEEFYISFETE
ncbi:hypothetical protein C0J52_01423 [Blattella germanica]|nr:hypothetical protein C0J52_01423 [Blattella germanica]